MQIDLLKAIGLLLIILAHVKPGFFIMQVRVFDVCLMVLVSGYLALASYSRSKSLKSYYWKRILRLYVPTALFLTCYFLFIWITRDPFPYSLEKVIRSYALFHQGSIGYVWIIRVFLLCAFMVPLFVRWKKYLFSKIGIVSLTSVYALYELIYTHTHTHTHTIAAILSRDIVCYAIGYGMVLFFGMLLQQLSKKNILKISTLFGIIYCGIAVYLYYHNGHYISVQGYKYPPQLYYLSYSIGVGYLLFAMTLNIHLKDWLYALVRFLSRNSLTIYFWHIFFLYLLSWNKIKAPWYMTYVWVIFASSLSTFLIDMMKRSIFKLYKKPEQVVESKEKSFVTQDDPSQVR